jgi:hypothetical protein
MEAAPAGDLAKQIAVGTVQRCEDGAQAPA